MALADPRDDKPWVPDDSDFGARLALVRWRMGWNVSEAATACDLNDQSWRNWEAGKLPRDINTVAQKISDNTGVSRLWLVTGAQNWKKSTTPDLHLLPVAHGQLSMDEMLGTPPSSRAHLRLVPV